MTDKHLSRTWKLILFITTTVLLSFSYAVEFEDENVADVDYSLESLLSRQSLRDPYFDTLLQKYRQVRESLAENGVEDKSPQSSAGETTTRMKINMPGVSPKKHDSYFCISKSMPADLNAFIVGYQPIAEMHTAHHMLLFGCEKPLHEEGKLWDCGEMEGVCGAGMQRILYAWGRNAPPLKLPKYVGFHVGKDSAVKHLALQVHYGNVQQFKNGKEDFSGVGLDLTTKNLSKRGGIYLLADGWSSVPPHRKKWHIDTGCIYTDPPTLQAFAFRVHAHKLGVVVSGYRVRDKVWTLIGKGDPQRPQAFYPSANLDIKTGDKLVARCTYNSMTRDRITHIGATMMDEMCNFYIMYYYKANGNLNPPGQSCTLNGMLTGSPLLQSFPKDSDIPLRPAETKREVDGEEPKKPIKPTKIIHKEVQGWPAVDLHVGQVTGVAIDLNGMVVIFHRGPNTWGAGTFDENNVLNKDVTKIVVNTVLYLDRKTGKVNNKLSWGADLFYLPHGLTIDHNGDVWLTDVGAHQVYKFGKHRSRPLLVLGEAKVPGSDTKHLCKPTDVAVDRSGIFYVSDGYCNQRVLVFTPMGKLASIISPKTSEGLPPPSNFLIPHSLALDEKKERLYVADRENNRVLIYDARRGQYLGLMSKQFHGPVYAISFNQGMLHAVTGESAEGPSEGLCIDAKTGTVQSVWKPEEGFGRPHDITSSVNNKEIYVVEIGPNRVRKFVKVRK